MRPLSASTQFQEPSKFFKGPHKFTVFVFKGPYNLCLCLSRGNFKENSDAFQAWNLGLCFLRSSINLIIERQGKYEDGEIKPHWNCWSLSEP